jgi:hypothetical protein
MLTAMLRARYEILLNDAATDKSIVHTRRRTRKGAEGVVDRLNTDLIWDNWRMGRNSKETLYFSVRDRKEAK